MKDFNLIITIGVISENKDNVITDYSDLLFFIKDNLPNDNFTIEVEEVGEYP